MTPTPRRIIDTVLMEFDGVLADTAAARRHALLSVLLDDGITLSPAMAEEVNARKIPGVRCVANDFRTWDTTDKFDGIISICMMDHLCSPQEAREGKAIGVSCVFSREAVLAPDASCALEGDGSLNCHGYGSVVSVTATFGLAAAGWVLDFMARRTAGA